MGSKHQQIRSQLTNWSLILLSDVFYVFVVKLIGIGTGNKIGIKFKGKFKDGIWLDVVWGQSLGVIC